MYNTRKVNEDITWVGGDDRRLAMFEGVYSIPQGVSYNSYLVMDEQTILFDTVDKAIGKVFFENVSHVLGERKLDYVVVQHMEPDHSATLMDLLCHYPEVKVVCNQKTKDMIAQFFGEDLGERAHLVKEGDTLSTGRHEFTFVFAPMVHWPEVMFTYDKTDHVLFSADAFGTFGALGGALFADEMDFYNECLPEARRYYTNIIGKYGLQVQSALKKACALDVAIICPLHGPVHRKDFGAYIDKYRQWSSYTPRKRAYARLRSIYGNTENAAAVLACRFGTRNQGAHVRRFQPPGLGYRLGAFRMSHLVFASSTYNAGIFITMEEVIRDLVLHNIQNRTVAFMENGTWAPASGKLMREMLCEQKDMTFLNETVTIRSALKPDQSGEIDTLVAAIRATISEKTGNGRDRPLRALYAELRSVRAYRKRG
jgi:flavorubredoxin